jgi:hypothetical protein
MDSQDSVCAGTVLDDDRLSPSLREALCIGPKSDVAAGARWRDDPYGLAGQLWAAAPEIALPPIRPPARANIASCFARMTFFLFSIAIRGRRSGASSLDTKGSAT